MALPAYARRAAVRRAAIDQYLLPAGPEQQTLLLWTDRRTDGRTPDKCIDPAYYAGSANKITVYVKPCVLLGRIACIAHIQSRSVCACVGCTLQKRRLTHDALWTGRADLYGPKKLCIMPTLHLIQWHHLATTIERRRRCCLMSIYFRFDHLLAIYYCRRTRNTKKYKKNKRQ